MLQSVQILVQIINNTKSIQETVIHNVLSSEQINS